MPVDGQIARLDADTNDDRSPDVIQVFENGDLSYQDEDTDFDGLIDQRFRNGEPVTIAATQRIPDFRFEGLRCGSFHGFWWKR